MEITREFVYTRAFLTDWKRVGMDDDDLAELEVTLSNTPKLGDVIPGAGRARKVRFAYEGRGKSGSIRVIYVDFEIGQRICGLAAYAKSERANLSEKDKRFLKDVIEILGETYDRR